MLPALPSSICDIFGDDITKIIQRYAYPIHPCLTDIKNLYLFIPIKNHFLSHLIFLEKISFVHKGEIVTLTKYNLEPYENDDEKLDKVINFESEFNTGDKDINGMGLWNTKFMNSVNYVDFIIRFCEHNEELNLTDFERCVYYKTLENRGIMMPSCYLEDVVENDEGRLNDFTINHKYIEYKLYHKIPPQSYKEKFVMKHQKHKVKKEELDKAAYIHHKLFQRIDPQSAKEEEILESVIYHIHETYDSEDEIDWDYLDGIFNEDEDEYEAEMNEDENE